MLTPCGLGRRAILIAGSTLAIGSAIGMFAGVDPAFAVCEVTGGVDGSSPGGAVFEGDCEDVGTGSGGSGGSAGGSDDAGGGDPDGTGPGGGGSGGPHGDGGGGGGGGDGGGSGPVTRVFEPFWSTDPASGMPCIALIARPHVTPDSTTAIAWERRTGEMYQDPRIREVEHRYCLAGTAAPLDPTVLARAFVRSIAVPAPEPVIAPGIALTGLPAYLVVEGPGELEATHVIAGFGSLVVALVVEDFGIDWGDGHTQVIEDGRRGVTWAERHLGVPITHVYTDRDPDTVVLVEARWVADWTLGAYRGRVTGITVDASIALPVREYVAVRLAPSR